MAKRWFKTQPKLWTVGPHGERESDERERSVEESAPTKSAGVSAYISSAGELSDLELVARVLAGDVNSYEPLVRRYQGQVMAHAQRMVGDADEAADVTQEVFVKIYTTLNQFRGQASFQTWVYRVTANLCVDRHRRKERSPRVTRSLEAPVETDSNEIAFEIADTAEEPQRCVISAEMASQVRAAVDALSDKLRSVVVLYDLEGLSYEEISSALGVPLGTVKSRLFHARAALKKLLGPYLED